MNSNWNEERNTNDTFQFEKILEPFSAKQEEIQKRKPKVELEIQQNSQGNLSHPPFEPKANHEFNREFDASENEVNCLIKTKPQKTRKKTTNGRKTRQKENGNENGKRTLKRNHVNTKSAKKRNRKNNMSSSSNGNSSPTSQQFICHRCDFRICDCIETVKQRKRKRRSLSPRNAKQNERSGIRGKHQQQHQQQHRHREFFHTGHQKQGKSERSASILAQPLAFPFTCVDKKQLTSPFSLENKGKKTRLFESKKSVRDWCANLLQRLYEARIQQENFAENEKKKKEENLATEMQLKQVPMLTSCNKDKKGESENQKEKEKKENENVNENENENKKTLPFQIQIPTNSSPLRSNALLFPDDENFATLLRILKLSPSYQNRQNGLGLKKVSITHIGSMKKTHAKGTSTRNPSFYIGCSDNSKIFVTYMECLSQNIADYLNSCFLEKGNNEPLHIVPSTIEWKEKDDLRLKQSSLINNSSSSTLGLTGTGSSNCTIDSRTQTQTQNQINSNGNQNLGNLNEKSDVDSISISNSQRGWNFPMAFAHSIRYHFTKQKNQYWKKREKKEKKLYSQEIKNESVVKYESPHTFESILTNFSQLSKEFSPEILEANIKITGKSKFTINNPILVEKWMNYHNSIPLVISIPVSKNKNEGNNTRTETNLNQPSSCTTIKLLVSDRQKNKTKKKAKTKINPSPAKQKPNRKLIKNDVKEEQKRDKFQFFSSTSKIDASDKRQGKKENQDQDQFPQNSNPNSLELKTAIQPLNKAVCGFFSSFISVFSFGCISVCGEKCVCVCVCSFVFSNELHI